MDRAVVVGGGVIGHGGFGGGGMRVKGVEAVGWAQQVTSPLLLAGV